MNKVNNGPVARLFRTLGFVFVLIATFILGVGAISALVPNQIANIVKPLKDFLTSGSFKFLIDYAYLFFIVGLGLLLWTQTKSYFIRVLFTVIGLLTIYTISFNGKVENFLPFKLSFKIGFITKFVSQSPWIALGMIIVSVFPIYLVLAYRKPDRSSANTTSAGLLILIIAIFAQGLSLIHPNNAVAGSDLFKIITTWIFAIGYLVTFIGSVLGILTFYKK